MGWLRGKSIHKVSEKVISDDIYCDIVSGNVPINVMPQYPPYGQHTGHIRGIDEKSVPHTGNFDIQIYAHAHIRTIKCNKLATP